MYMHPPSFPLSIGSCREAGYSGCCVLSDTDMFCEGTLDCYCDTSCLLLEDCCPDFFEICSTTTTSPNGGLKRIEVKDRPPSLDRHYVFHSNPSLNFHSLFMMLANECVCGCFLVSAFLHLLQCMSGHDQEGSSNA